MPALASRMIRSPRGEAKRGVGVKDASDDEAEPKDQHQGGSPGATGTPGQRPAESHRADQRQQARNDEVGGLDPAFVAETQKTEGHTTRAVALTGQRLPQECDVEER